MPSQGSPLSSMVVSHRCVGGLLGGKLLLSGRQVGLSLSKLLLEAGLVCIQLCYAAGNILLCVLQVAQGFPVCVLQMTEKELSHL